MRVPGRRVTVAALAVVCAAAAADSRVGNNVAMTAHASRSLVNYTVPDLQLVRDDGKVVRLKEELDGERSVVLSFIYTACTAICPITSATFAQLQHRLGTGNSRVQLVSISIDPEQDTPAQLAVYGRKFRAGPGWRFYTGTAAASIAVQRAFDAYGGDKMRHSPDTYVRRAGSQQWVRLRGFASAEQLLKESGAAEPAPSARSVGESIYRDGVLPGGSPIVGARGRLPALSGDDAACVRCHRRSGLGSAEGPFAIPPIASRFLAQARDESRLSANEPLAPGYHVGRAAYTDATLARAISEGVVPGNGALYELMPRYPFTDQAMTSLIAYMKTLGHVPAPGVTEHELHFATIVTPDADPVARQGMLDVLRHYFAAPNPAPGAPRKLQHEKWKVGFRSGAHQWVLHVWQLTGSPDTWERQLHHRLAAEPVFAILSGLGGKDWAPVHRFCEHEAIPCLLPNVDLPVVAEHDFYPVYFSRGVLLEAQLGAHWLGNLHQGGSVRRIVQVYNRDDIGVAAARSLHELLSAAGIVVVDQALASGADQTTWLRAVGEAGPEDALVLWARSDELAGLAATPPQAGTVLVSGLMAGPHDLSVQSARAKRVTDCGAARLAEQEQDPDRQ